LRNSGIEEFWDWGILELRDSGIEGFWNWGIPKFAIPEFQNFRILQEG
jgi:hypothetical protein